MRQKFDLANPCRDCIARSEVCHVTCNAYKAWKIVTGRETDKYKRKHIGDKEAWARQNDSAIKWSKQMKWRKR